MRIDYTKSILNKEEIAKKYAELQRAIPELSLIPLGKGPENRFAGLYSTGNEKESRENMDQWTESNYNHLSDVSVFYNFNIASVNNFRASKPKFNKDREEIKNDLKKLGYLVSEKGHQGSFYELETMCKLESEVTELESLWSEIKKDANLISKQLDNLLTPLFSDSESKKVVFYNPVTEYWEQLMSFEEAYNPYSEIISVRQESLVPTITELIMSRLTSCALAISSQVGDKQYAQIDFQTKDLDEVKKTLNALNLKGGHIINSGNSFHFYDGSKFMNQDKWYGFMEDLKEYTSIGEIWPKLQQVQGFSMLRIIPCDDKLYFPEHVSYSQPL
ncbi:MAG: hypothetical protein AB7V77_00060 [Candidatus Woesearchaeota archaeon]